jgi:hypothetical protein
VQHESIKSHPFVLKSIKKAILKKNTLKNSIILAKRILEHIQGIRVYHASSNTMNFGLPKIRDVVPLHLIFVTKDKADLALEALESLTR